MLKAALSRSNVAPRGLRAKQLFRITSRSDLLGCTRNSQHLGTARNVSNLPLRDDKIQESSSVISRSRDNAANIPRTRFDDLATHLSWPDGSESRFDNTFLYDHCRCSTCFHPGTKQRLKTLSEIPTDIHPLTAEIDANANALRITWPDDPASPHQSSFPLSFLRQASYDPPLPPRGEVDDSRVLWSSKIVQSPPTIRYQDVMHNDQHTKDRTILKLLDRVYDFGFCFVTDVPPTPEQTQHLIEDIAPIRQTHYGGFWDFTADMSHGDLAYSSESLPAHTDTTYFTDPAGLQIFHLLSHPSPPGSGGTTLLVDAFYTASLLSTLHPTSYSLLSRLRIPAHASGTPGTLLRPPISQPVFRHDERGRLTQVRWNNEDRGVLGQGWTADEVRGWYQAARRFDQLNRSEDAEYWVQLNPGTMLVIDNWRVMHGRSAFTGQRRMCGAYVGADDWLSRRTALRHQLAKRKETEEAWTVAW